VSQHASRSPWGSTLHHQLLFQQQTSTLARVTAAENPTPRCEIKLHAGRETQPLKISMPPEEWDADGGDREREVHFSSRRDF